VAGMAVRLHQLRERAPQAIPEGAGANPVY
jgi:hypothetical protein